MKKIVLIVVPLLLLLGGGAAAIFTGILHVPGLSPAKKGQASAQLYAEDPDKLAEVATPAPAVSAPVEEEPPRRPPAGPQIVVRPEEGDKRLAVLWNELDSPKLSRIVVDWKDEDLARVLAQMEDQRVAGLMASLEPSRASTLSKALQRATSRILVGPDGQPVEEERR